LQSIAKHLYEPVCGTLRSLKDQQFDTIVYIDVLEHKEDDREELERATLHLRSKGHLIVLSPAHQSLRSMAQSVTSAEIIGLCYALFRLLA
jgi:2-polyprenyl-3-methyl-5-hydroxy-6-metoxy-1,4-benzoquinol methylase